MYGTIKNWLVLTICNRLMNRCDAVISPSCKAGILSLIKLYSSWNIFNTPSSLFLEEPFSTSSAEDALSFGRVLQIRLASRCSFSGTLAPFPLHSSLSTESSFRSAVDWCLWAITRDAGGFIGKLVLSLEIWPDFIIYTLSFDDLQWTSRISSDLAFLPMNNDYSRLLPKHV